MLEQLVDDCLTNSGVTAWLTGAGDRGSWVAGATEFSNDREDSHVVTQSLTGTDREGRDHDSADSAESVSVPAEFEVRR